MFEVLDVSFSISLSQNAEEGGYLPTTSHLLEVLEVAGLNERPRRADLVSAVLQT